MQHLIRLHTAGLELTLACPCRCETCGSSAGRRRPDELSTDEWKRTIHDLAELGCRRVTFLGGEPLLRNDWPELAEAVVACGMIPDMITSGLGLDQDVVDEMVRVGVITVTVSVDGTRDVHDEQRRVPGCFDQALEAMGRLDRAGLQVGVTTQLNQKSLPTLAALAPQLQKAGAAGWQVQLTMPTGRANSDVVLPPEALPDVFASLRQLVRRRGLRPFITDNVGYLTADDPLLRTPQGIPPRCWLGCFAGLRNVGIASDGSVRGCLALPYEMKEGNVRDEPLAVIWADMSRFRYNRCFDPSDLSGACAECVHGEVCRGGCTAMAVATHGRPGISQHCQRLHES